MLIKNTDPEMQETNIVPLHLVEEIHGEPRGIPASFARLGREAGMPDPLRAFPDGYEAGEDGIYVWEHGAEESERHWLCGPLIVEAHACTSSRSDWHTCLRFLDRDGHSVSLALSDADINCTPSAVLAQLVQQGLRVTPEKRLKEKFRYLLMQWDTRERMTLVDQFGWTDQTASAFVLGDGSVIGTTRVLPRPHLIAAHGTMPQSQGTLEDWRRQVSLRAVGNPLMITAIALGLSGPLLQLLGLEGGGLHVHGASSTGKSTLLRLGNSVWGASDHIQSWNGTRNALEVIGARHSGRLLTLDEIGEADPRSIGETIYALANGKGRSRLDTRLHHNTLTWQLSVLSSGELSLGEHMDSVGKENMAGQSVRLLDIPIDSEAHGAFRCFHDCATADEFAKSINRIVARYYRVAGPAFVHKLIDAKRKETFLETLNAAHRDIMKKLQADAEFQADGLSARALQRFAVIALAGELATEYGITGWTRIDAVNTVREVTRLWSVGRDLPTRRDLDATRARITAFIAAHGASMVPLRASDPGVARSVHGWVDAEAYYFTSEAWQRMHVYHDPTGSAQQVRVQGGLKLNERNLQFKMPHAIPGRPRAYAVRRAWLEPGADIASIG